MQLPGELGRLCYCTNIHAGESWPAVRDALDSVTRRVKDMASPEAPFGVGLRLSAIAAEALTSGAHRAELKAIFERRNFELFTINGFPFGPFHGERVKEDVYAPDWRTVARVEYTNNLIDLLADIGAEASDHAPLSLSTVPGAFKPNGLGAEAEMVENFLRSVAHAVAARERTGRTVALALEPEPYCFIETIAETVAFFEDHLFTDRSAARLAELTGLDRGAAADALRRHLGVCYDVCHAAVEFEDPQESVAALRRAEIPIPKLQLSSALRIPTVSSQARIGLAEYAEPTYLHQVIARDDDGSLTRYLDLPEALSQGATADGQEWRVHFHVPIFIAELERFSTTQAFLIEILKMHAGDPISPHLEVETYTWDVLPPSVRVTRIEDAIARELSWVRDQLDSAMGAAQ